MTGEGVLWLFVVVIAFAFFAYNLQRFTGYLRLGVGADRTDSVGARLTNLLEIGIFQRKIFREKRRMPSKMPSP